MLAPDDGLNSRQLMFAGIAAMGMLAASWIFAARAMNRHSLEVTAEQATVTQGPIPMPGSIIDRKHARQLYSFRYWPHDTPSATPLFGVRVITSSGRHEELARGFASVDEARRVEQQIESAFGIRDRAVREEVAKRGQREKSTTSSTQRD